MTERWEPKERKSFPFVLEEKGVDMEERTFKGYAAVYGHFDGKDIIDKGAGKKTLAEAGHRVKIYHIHNWNEPTGKPIELREVPRSKLPPKVLERAPDATGGLYVHGYISKTTRGEDDLVLMRDGVLDELSIGFDTVKEEREEHEKFGNVRHIKEYKLYDISLVPLAMQEGAIVVDVKAAWEEKVEETDDFIHVPAPGEAGKHEGDDHRLRTIMLSEDEGIQAVFCGVCKVNTKYIFEKEKTWTVKKAVAWVKEHHEKESDKAIFLFDFEAADLEARIQRARIQRQGIEAI